MSFNMPFTKENLNSCLKELAKEFRKLNGTAIPAEIILIGGASILANYGFREMTYDMDAIISASSAMKEAVNRVGDKFNLPNGWLNTDFTRTKSYTPKLVEVSIYYKTFSNVLVVRTIAAEYLIAMKLMSGREYKYDLSDIVGILLEHKKSGNPISREAINNAITQLYGGWQDIPESSKALLDVSFTNEDYEKVYQEIRANEKESKEILLDFEEKYPNAITENNLSDILEMAKRKKNEK